MSDFLDDVTDAFAPMIADGRLHVESSQFHSEFFDNAVVVLAGGNFRIRVIRDRDETFADAASGLRPEEWFPLQRVICAVGVAIPPPEGLITPTEAAEMVERFFLELEAGLAAERMQFTQAALSKLGHQALERMIATANSLRDSAS